MRNIRQIRKPVAIAVEGKDYLFSLLSQIDGPPEFEDVELWDFAEGGQTFTKWLESFKTLREFQTIRSIGLIRDAEDNATQTISSVRASFETNGFNIPETPLTTLAGFPCTGFLIMPHGENSGCLENAMLTSATVHVPLRCSEEYLSCVDNARRNDNWRAKVKVHSLIAASQNPAVTLGQSCHLNMWNFEHPALSIMVDFIRTLAAR